MIRVYGTVACPYCDAAKHLLKRTGLDFTYIDINKDEEAKNLILSQGFKTVPQIFDGMDHVGGYAELTNYVLDKALPLK